MKIVNPSAGKSGVVGQGNPFKKVMNGTNGTNGTNGSLGNGPQQKQPVLTAPPQLKVAKKLPGGVTPLTASAPKPIASQPVAPNLKALNAAASTRTAARAEAHAKADNLVELRSHSTEQNKQRYDTRLLDLICQELKIEFSNELSRPQAANSDKQGLAPVMPQQQQVATVTPISQAKAQHEAQLKAASAVQLIEKIEAFVKSQRPGLSLTLDGSIGARVEIERLGPKEVALRVVGKNGPPAPEDIGRIREEMRARGLKVGALSVA